ncbi:MAG: acyl-CoA dehydrogenase family protein [Sandaracinobacter sp.]
MFLDAFTRLLEAHCTPAVVRSAQADPDAAEPLRAVLAGSGFLDILLPQEQGGAGLPLADFAPLAMAAGAVLLPVPFAETAVQRLTGHPPTPEAAAALSAARMAGAIQRVFDMTVQHVTTRTQFGRPISSFQAVQHQVAVMAEEVAAAALAAHIGLQGPGFSAERSAIASLRCAEAADVIAATAHQQHGAIGATAEFDLQLWTTELRRLRRSHGTHGTSADAALRLGMARAAATHHSSLSFVERILT